MNISPQTSLLASVLQGKRSSSTGDLKKTVNMSDFLAHLRQANVQAGVVRNEPIAQRKMLDLLDTKVGMSQNTLTQLSSSLGELPPNIEPTKVGEDNVEMSIRQLLAWAGATNIPTQAGTLPTADLNPENWSIAIGKLTSEVKSSVESAVQSAFPNSVEGLFPSASNCKTEGESNSIAFGIVRIEAPGGSEVEVKGHPVPRDGVGTGRIGWGGRGISGAFGEMIAETTSGDSVSVKGHPISSEMTKLMDAAASLWQGSNPGEAATASAQTGAGVLGSTQSSNWNAGSTQVNQEVKDGIGRFGSVDGVAQAKIAELLSATGAKIVSAETAEVEAENQSSVNAVAMQASMTSAKTVKNAAFGLGKLNGTDSKPKVNEFEELLETASPDGAQEESFDLADSLLKSMKSVRKNQLEEENQTQTEVFTTDLKVETKIPTISKEAAQKVIMQTSDAMSDLAAAKRPGSVVIKLNPEDLGSLTVRVRSTGSRIEANVTASNDAVREALHAHRADLVHGVESRGFSLGSLQIGQESNSQPANPPAAQPNALQANLQQNGQGQNQNAEKSMTQDFERMGNMAAHLGTREQIAAQQVVASTIGVNYLA